MARSRYDNWLIYEMKRNKIPVIDCTKRIIAIHQNHPKLINNNHPEVQYNFKLYTAVVQSSRIYGVKHADKII